jgi:hypothetical protein
LMKNYSFQNHANIHIANIYRVPGYTSDVFFTSMTVRFNAFTTIRSFSLKQKTPTKNQNP